MKLENSLKLFFKKILTLSTKEKRKKGMSNEWAGKVIIQFHVMPKIDPLSYESHLNPPLYLYPMLFHGLDPSVLSYLIKYIYI